VSHEVNVIDEKGFHHPLAPKRCGLVRDTEDTEENILMENREVPILHKCSGLRRQGVLNQQKSFLIWRYLPPNQKKISSVTSESLW
jgi:hypothetical protein